MVNSHSTGGFQMTLAPQALSPRMELSRRVLLVDASRELRLSLTPSLRTLGCEAVSVDSLLAARVELARFRPMMVLVDWRSLPPEGASGCMTLRGQPHNGDVPILIVVGDGTPAELLEACVRSGAEDCLLGPVRLAELRARLDVLRERPPGSAPRVVERHLPCSVLVVGEEAGMSGSLGSHLEACGHHLLYAPDTERALALAAEYDEAIHLVLVRGGARLPAEELPRLEHLRSDARLARAPLVVVTEGEGREGPAHGALWLSARTLPTRYLLARINALLHRNLQALLVDERVPFVCPVEFREVGAFSWSSCYSSELSPGALFVRTLVPVRPGAAVDLRIHLPTTREVLEGSGLVAWSNPYTPRRIATYPLGMGIQFLGLSPRRLMQLRELIRVSGCA